MMVGRRRVGQHLATGIARHHDRDLHFQIHSLFGDTRLTSQGRPCIPNIYRAVELHLTAPIVPAVGAFEINPFS